MAKTRVWLENKIIENLKFEYNEKIFNEFKFYPTLSHIVEIALCELESYKKNKEINISFTKRGKRLIIK